MADTDFGREHRTPDQIERELEQTRSDISRTIEAIQSRITPGQLANEAYGYLRDGSGEFGKNLGTAVKTNPVPMVLIGLGIAWLMMGRGTPAYLRGASVGEYGGAAAESGTSFGDAANAAGESVSSTASAASERVRRMSDDVRHLASEWADEAGGIADSARAQVHRAGDAVQQQAMQVRDGARQMLRDQPLVAGALGIAIGAVLGALLPLSRRENELMGETRDQLLDEAMAYGHQGFDQAVEVANDIASAASEAAKEEAEKQGLMGDDTESHKPTNGGGGQSNGPDERWSGGSPRSGFGGSSDDPKPS